MDQHIIKIKSVDHVTHDVLRFITEKPANFNFEPGQASRISINKEGWEKKKRSFTFTSLPEDDHLEFVIKTYPSHEGVTNELLTLKAGDELILHEVWGVIAYKGGGVFIAGGAGVTPFISIFRYLQGKKQLGNNKLLFANKTVADIIHKREFKDMLGENFINILSQEEAKGFEHGLINEEFLKKHGVNDHEYVYLCGPKPMMDNIEEQLLKLNVEKNAIVKEEF